ncbi:hypothetical protein SDJN03_16636, partial [Cucurbita argyrosperma subsp. sororia]
MNSVAAALELKIASDNQKTPFDGSPEELTEAIGCQDREGNECIGLKAVVSFSGPKQKRTKALLAVHESPSASPMPNLVEGANHCIKAGEKELDFEPRKNPNIHFRARPNSSSAFRI